MNHRILIGLIGILLLGGGSISAQKDSSQPPDFQIKDYINKSYNFLLNREPEMTAPEYALYEQVLPMIFDEPEVATLLLESMLADDDPESPAFAYVLANVYFSNDQHDLAEKHYKSAIDEYPDFLRAWTNLGFLYYSLERFGEAIPCLIKAISLGEQDPQVKGLLGYSLIEINNPLAAEAAFLQAFSTDPENSDWIEALLNLYLDTAQLERAESLIRQLIKLDPREKANWAVYYTMLLSADRKVEAIIVLETLKEFGLADLEENLLLGDLYAQHGLFPEALATYGLVVQSDALTGTDRLLQYAQVLIETGSYTQAEHLLTAASRTGLAEKRVDLLMTQVRLLMARDDWSEATALLDEILILDPLCGEALLAMGRIHTKQEQFPKAEFLFNQAAKVSASAFQANVELANLALREHHYQKGIDYLRAALKIEQRSEIEAYILRLESLISSS